MRIALLFVPAALLLLAAAPAIAQDDTLCSDRPGKATPSCTVSPGTLQIETSALDWTHDKAQGVRTDTLLFGDTLVRYGVGADTEVRLGFTPYVRERTRDGGGVSIADGFGDVGVSIKHRLLDGGDEGISVAALAFVSLPVGSDAVSAGTVAGGLAVPVDVPLPGGWALNATPTIEAAADEDGDGRHLSYAGVVALSHPVTATLDATGEFFVQRDADPLGHTTQATADLLLAWQPLASWQFDVSTYLGLNRDTPDVEVLGGFTRRF